MKDGKQVTEILEAFDRSNGKIRADVSAEKLEVLGFEGSDRTVRRAVAEVKASWRASRWRVYRPWIVEPDMWAQWDWGQGATIAGLTLGSGADGPESYGRALWEIAHGDTGATLGWRPDALRLIVNFGDDVPLDTNINQGVEGGVLSGDTGVDSGRNATVDCGDDDIDFQDDALGELNAAGIRLLHVDSSGGSTMEPYWRSWVSLTNGSYVKLDDGRSLSDAIVELLSLL